MLQENARNGSEGQGATASIWPIVVAASLTVACVGLIINFVVAAVGGVLTVATIIAWGLERFQGPGAGVVEHGPRERVELPALGEGEAEAETPLEVGRSPSWWGMVWFIATEATFFAFLIGSYVYLRVGASTWPPANMPFRELAFPSVNTVILLLSGVPALLAHRAIRNGNRRGLITGLLLAALLGAIFLAGQGYEYVTGGLDPRSSVFAAGFYTLTGFHGAHVAIGIGLLLIMAVLAARNRFSVQHHFGVEFASTYWHFVDAVWIFLFSLLYLFQ